jgi:hypothetical protein
MPLRADQASVLRVEHPCAVALLSCFGLHCLHFAPSVVSRIAFPADFGVQPRNELLVGHSTLSITLRYMNPAPSALCEAIGLLDFGQPVGSALGLLNRLRAGRVFSRAAVVP